MPDLSSQNPFFSRCLRVFCRIFISGDTRGSRQSTVTRYFLKSAEAVVIKNNREQERQAQDGRIERHSDTLCHVPRELGRQKVHVQNDPQQGTVKEDHTHAGDDEEELQPAGRHLFHYQE